MSTFEKKKLRILLDLDGTITYDPNFFSTFCKAMRSVAEIHVVTHRPEEQLEMTIQDLKNLEIEYDFLALTSEKLKYALEKDINIVFEDIDHYFKYMPNNITVFKIRETDNWDWKSRRWVYDNKSGVHIEDL